LEDRALFAARLAIGLVQGFVLYLLYRAQEAGAWPATEGLVFVPLLLVMLAGPVGLNLSLGSMPWRKAVLWVAGASAMLALLGFFDNWMAGPLERIYDPDFSRPLILPSWRMFVFGTGALFIAQALMTGGMADRRFRAAYPTHFDVAWKLAVQLALAAFFTVVFWLLLQLGAALFGLIRLDFLKTLLEREWFIIPLLTLAVAGGLHLTDIRPALVQGARTLLLTLLSWLLPVITLIVAGFVASLPFTGLAPLWSFGHATALLLAAAAALIVLINAAYQDGVPERQPPKLLRLAARVAAVLTLPLALIATYALFLRVNQYGWTADRVTVAAILLVALAYAGGYAWAALAPGPWLSRLEPWNFNVALLALTLVILMFTPLLSPQRIGVHDQMARLRSGAVTPEKFDLLYLRDQGGRYGAAALAQLAQGPETPLRRRAQAALERKRDPKAALSPQLLADLITVHPRGEKLPPGFLTTNWKNAGGNSCLMAAEARCDAMLVDLDGDGRREILLQQYPWEADIYREAEGGWRLAGSINLPRQCPKLMEQLRAGNYRVVPPERRWNEIEVAGLRLPVNAQRGTGTVACPS
jgi:hypothetical protein